MTCVPCVIGPPIVSDEYLDRYVAKERDTVKIICPISGVPKPIIEWYQVRIETLRPSFERFT